MLDLTAAVRRPSKVSPRVASPLLPLKCLLSNTPVKETPSSLSSSALSLQTLRTYLNFVSVDCHVPRIAASSTLRVTDSTESSGRTTTSDKLHSPELLKKISAQGFR